MGWGRVGKGMDRKVWSGSQPGRVLQAGMKAWKRGRSDLSDHSRRPEGLLGDAHWCCQSLGHESPGFALPTWGVQTLVSGQSLLQGR